MMLLALPAAFSCEFVAMMDNSDNSVNGDGRLMITGTVSDMETRQPIEGIKVTFGAVATKADDNRTGFELTVYTDNKGTYAIEAEGFSKDIKCVLKAEDPDGVYDSSTQEVDVKWSGVAFDEHKNTFIVNDCDFKLVKK